MPIVSMIAMCVLVLSWWLFLEILGVIGAFSGKGTPWPGARPAIERQRRGSHGL